LAFTFFYNKITSQPILIQKTGVMENNSTTPMQYTQIGSELFSDF